MPVVSDDAIFNAASAAGSKNFGAGATVGAPLTVGSISVTATTGSYTIRNSTTGATNATITLGGAGNLGNSVSGNPADLLYAAASTVDGSTLTLTGPNASTGTGALNIVLGQSGNFNAVRGGTTASTDATIVVSAAISDGGNNYTITKNGGGVLTLSAPTRLAAASCSMPAP